MIKIDHLAFWVNDLELIRGFYERYFAMTSSAKYHNPQKNFSSYFLSFSQESARIEIMHRNDILEKELLNRDRHGITHFAISVGSKDSVDALTERLRTDKYKIEGEPRTTGDGYYESVVLDPEGNRIEITI